MSECKGNEFKGISEICRKYKIPLYLDGARLGYGIMSNNINVTLPLITEYSDVFYIGGTKTGALCGEAVVFTKKYPKEFYDYCKTTRCIAC